MRVNRSNRFPLLLASGPRGVPPPQRVTPTLLSGNGGARKFQHATRIKKKEKEERRGREIRRGREEGERRKRFGGNKANKGRAI